MKLKYYQVDAFAENVFKGNPAGVIFSELDDEMLMQKIAFENNLSETAFVSKKMMNILLGGLLRIVK